MTCAICHQAVAPDDAVNVVRRRGRFFTVKCHRACKAAEDQKYVERLRREREEGRAALEAHWARVDAERNRS